MVASLAVMVASARALGAHGGVFVAYAAIPDTDAHVVGAHRRVLVAPLVAHGCVHGRVVGTLALMVSSMALMVASLVAHGCVHGRVVGTLALIVSSMARMVALLALMVASLVGHGCVLDGHGRDFGSHGAVSSWLRR